MAQALIYDRIGFLSVQPLKEKFRLQGYKHYVVSGLSEVITENGEDCHSLVSKKWTNEVRSKDLSVVIKGHILKLLPAFKIQRGLELHHICKAFAEVEQRFLKKMKEVVGECPKAVHLQILEEFPTRLVSNEYFKPLVDTDYKPNYK